MSQTNGKVVHDFTEGPITKSLLLFAAPLFLSSLLQIVYNMVDMLVVGRFCGSAGLSAVSVGGDISNTMTIIAMSFSNAGSVIIAQFIGAKQRDKVGRFIGTLFVFLFGAAVVIAIVGLALTGQILGWMNTPAEAWNEALLYCRICMVGLVFTYGYNIVSAVLRGAGDSRHPFWFIAIASVMNIILDVLFVGGFHWGAGGAALATVIGQTFSFLVSAVFLIRNKDNLGFELEWKFFRIDREMLKILLNLGIPMALKQSAVNISKLVMNSFVNSFGVTVSAVSGVGHKLTQIANLFANSTNTAGSTMVGQNIGAEKYHRVTKIVLSVFAITAVSSLALSALMITCPEMVFGLFTSDEEVIRVGMEYVPVAITGFISCISRSGSNALINGSANYKVNYAVAIMDGIVMRIGFGLFFGLVLNWGYLGFWYGDAVAGFTPFVIGTIYYLSGSWKTRKYVVK